MQRAEELSAELQDVAKKNHKYYKHFDVYYMDNPINKGKHYHMLTFCNLSSKCTVINKGRQLAGG